jgi:hypothetical protein
MRYSDKDIDKQVALKDVISKIDPSMSFFYGFNNNKISDCYEIDPNKNEFLTDQAQLDHMYSDLMNIYE